MVLNLTLKVHPVVLFQIINAYERRNLDRTSILGTLLGTIDKNCVEVSNCFVVPHSISPQDGTVSIEMHIADTMYKLNKQVHPAEVIVGWWATGFEVTSIAVPINDYYARQCPKPVHILVDTTCRTGRLSIKGFVQVDIGVPDRSQGAMFSPIPVELLTYPPEAVAVKTLLKTRLTPSGKTEPRAELPQITEACGDMEEGLNFVLNYVEDVLSDRVAADNSVGRNLLKLVQVVPKMNTDELDNMLNANIKDLLMSMYLAQLTRVQVQLNEKLLMSSTNLNPNQ